MTTHAVTPLEFDGLVPATPPTALPEVTWIDPKELLVDEGYQRDLTERSRKLIRRIVEGWDWRKFKPPIVAWTEAGLEVLDGQHSATAAATHPAIERIPVVIVDAKEQQDRASAFIGHNRDRIAVSPSQLHAAAVTAGDAEALAVEGACALANVSLLRTPPSADKYRPADTIAATAIAGLVKRHQRVGAAEILATLACARLAPITANHIKAAEALVHDPEYGVPPADLAKTLIALDLGPADREARTFAATHNVPHWKGLVAIWFKATKKPRRKPADAGVSSAPARVVSGHGNKPETPVGAKRDKRPDLNGWQSGPLIKRCPNCGDAYVGGLKAAMCADCAYGAREAA